jgi:AcrR family transcriptional regulator
MAVATPRTPRRKLDREAIVDAALALADADGLEAITLKRVADRFGVTAMALYWHFEDKDALLGAVGDRIWQTAAQALERSMVGAAPAQDDGWGQLRLTLDALVCAMRAHPATAELVARRVAECEAGLEITELTLGLLARHGITPEAAADLARFILCSAVMLVDNQAGIEIVDPAQRAEQQRRKRITLASLPADRYPHTVAAAAYLTDCDSPDRYFARGFDAIIAGVRAQAPSSTPSTA